MDDRDALLLILALLVAVTIPSVKRAWRDIKRGG
jgi:hypothetical protein